MSRERGEGEGTRGEERGFLQVELRHAPSPRPRPGRKLGRIALDHGRQRRGSGPFIKPPLAVVGKGAGEPSGRLRPPEALDPSCGRGGPGRIGKVGRISKSPVMMAGSGAVVSGRGEGGGERFRSARFMEASHGALQLDKD